MMIYSKNNEQRIRLTPVITFMLSLVLGVAIGGVLIAGGAAAGSLVQVDPKTAWYITRSTGTVAYLLLTASTAWGLLLSAKLIKEAVPAPLALAMHNTLSWLAISLTGIHVFALLFDNYYTYRLVDLVFPFIGPYRPEWVGLGIIGFYLMALTSASFSWRKRIGQTWWKRLHKLTFAAFGLVSVHGLMAGTDSTDLGMKALFLGSTLLVLFLTNYRLVAGQKQRRSRQA